MADDLMGGLLGGLGGVAASGLGSLIGGLFKKKGQDPMSKYYKLVQDKIEPMLKQTFDQNMAESQAFGGTAQRNIKDWQREQLNSMLQSSLSGGLNSTSVLPGMRAGLGRQATRMNQDLQETLAQQRNALRSGYTQQRMGAWMGAPYSAGVQQYGIDSQMQQDFGKGLGGTLGPSLTDAFKAFGGLFGKKGGGGSMGGMGRMRFMGNSNGGGGPFATASSSGTTAPNLSELMNFAGGFTP